MKYLKRYNEKIEWNWVQEEEDPNSLLDDFKGYEDFYNFLKDNGHLEKWINNLNKEDKTIHIFLIDNKYDKEEFINFAFTWSRTPEGHIYWENCSEKWKRIIR